MPENDAVTDPGAEPAETPSLELPSLFGRRKKRSKKAAPPADPPVVQDEPPVVQDEPPDVQDDPPVAAVDEEPTTVVPVVDSAPPDETVVIPAVEEEPRADTVEPPSVADEPSTDTAEPSTDTAEPPLVQDEPPAAVAEPASIEAEDEEPVATRRTTRLPALAASTAAVAVGAVVGLLGCALTFLGLKMCELITGADSCGGPGLLVLIVIVVLMILAGAALLRMFTVEDATNLSFLGVGITVAFVLMFLLDYLYEPWMFLVMPVLTALAFLVARWITTRYVEDVLADDDREVHDIR